MTSWPARSSRLILSTAATALLLACAVVRVVAALDGDVEVDVGVEDGVADDADGEAEDADGVDMAGADFLLSVPWSGTGAVVRDAVDAGAKAAVCSGCDGRSPAAHAMDRTDITSRTAMAAMVGAKARPNQRQA